nr:MAG TPA: hypothetical protein [Caudoviricetes sp.]
MCMIKGSDKNEYKAKKKIRKKLLTPKSTL